MKMKYKEQPLLTVEDHFMIEGRGLVLCPQLDIPPEEYVFKPFSDQALISRPDGSSVQFKISFAAEHFTLVGGGGRWNIVLMIPDATRESVPVGSQVFVSSEAKEKLKGELAKDQTNS